MKKSIDFLFKDSCPSILYRIRKELLGESINSFVMENLQEQIQNDKFVKSLLELQKENGWIGNGFHIGNPGAELCIRVLIEKGVEKTNPQLNKALQAIEVDVEDFDGGEWRIGKILDDKGLGGTKLMRAVLLAQAGIESQNVKEEIRKSIDCFQAVVNLKSFSDISLIYKDKLVFKDGSIWPSIYHLRLLAYTSSWKSIENLNLMTTAIQKMIDLSPIPYIKVKEGSQLIAPAAVFMDDFKLDMENLDSKGWLFWFHKMELLSRLGVIKGIPELSGKVRCLENILRTNNDRFPSFLKHSYYTEWSQYVGLALENDWKLQDKRVNDLTFRSLLIIFYSDMKT